MKRTVFTLAATCIAVCITSGCSTSKQVVKKELTPQAVRTEQPAAVASAPFIASGKVVNAIAATVNDEIITLVDVYREALPVIHESEKKGPVNDAERHRIRRAALDLLIEKKLVEQKIREMNIRVGEDEIRQAIEDVKRQNGLNEENFAKALAAQGFTLDQYREQLRNQLERLRLISMEVRSRIQVGDSEVRAYYNANLDKYREEDTFRARHIFFKISAKSPDAEIKRAMNSALMVLAEARSGKDFAELARTYSEDPAAHTNGGDLGSFKKGDMQPELEQAILTLKPGEVSELVYTPLGFHLIKLEERISGKPKPFESYKTEIEETLYRKKSEERFSKWAKDLRGKANIEIKELPGLL